MGFISRLGLVRSLFLSLCFVFIGHQLLRLTQLGKEASHENENETHAVQPPLSESSSSSSKRTAKGNGYVHLDTFNEFLVVDILSIGSKQRLEYLEAQRNTFGMHKSVRHFFNATEDDDGDPLCSQKLTKWNVTMISRFCKRNKKWHPKRQFLMSYLQSAYANEVWLRRKANSPGWMCAQTRPMQGFFKVMQYYKSMGEPFPDYLIVVDDDTLYNLPLFQEHFMEVYPNSSKPLAIAGCLVRSPVHQINFTIPFGGYGLVLSKGYLEKMQRPIECPRDRAMCHAIHRTSHLDERNIFSSGMSLVELMYTYSINQPYLQFSKWTTGFCMHSDWLWGYITNFYNVSEHIADPAYSDVPQARMEAYLGSELNAGDADQANHRICDFQRGNCHALAHACHYSTPEEMIAVSNRIRSMPQYFRSFSHPPPVLSYPKTVPETSTSLNVDIISIGSQDRPEQQRAQRDVIASHPSVTNFFSINEADAGIDSGDPFCGSKQPLALSNMKRIADWCLEASNWDGENPYFSVQRRAFLEAVASNRDRLGSWLCEQRLPLIGMTRVFEDYTKPGRTIPDFLLVVADDTYFNMDIFPEMLRNIRDSNRTTITPESPWTVSGCLEVQRDENGTPIVFIPRLDYGLILTRSTIERLMRPLSCDNGNHDLIRADKKMCESLERDRIGELGHFRPSMSLLGVMSAFTQRSHSGSSTIGSCFATDWSLGWLLGSYGVSLSPWPSVGRVDYSNAPEKTIHPYLDSMLDGEESKMMCRHRGAAHCHRAASVCSKIPANVMLSYSKRYQSIT